MAYLKNALNIWEYEYDFAVDGGATGVYDLSAKANKGELPNGAVRLWSSIVVQTALQGSGASAKVGTSANDADLAANAAVASWSASAIFNDTTPIYVGTTNGDTKLTVAGGALTAGKIKVFVGFVVPTT